MAYVRLPNDSYFPIAEGETPEQALQAAQQKYPRAFLTEKELEERQGFGAATKEAFKRAKAGSYEAAGKLFGSDTLKQLAEQEQKELKEQPGFLPTTEEDRAAAFKKGLFSGIGALGREYISEPVGGMVGRYGVPLGIGAGVAAAAPAAGVVGIGATIAGGAATALADYLPQVGENLERQRNVKQPEDLQSAALAGIPQAVLSGLNIRLGMLPKNIQNIFRADAAALQKQVLAGMKPEEAIAKLSSNLKNILLSTGSAGIVGAGTMGGEEVIRRQQAGQSLTDEAAREDYLQIAKDAATIAPLFGVPRGALKRRAEKRGIESAGQEFTAAEGVKERARQDAEAAAEADLKQAEELRARQAGTMGPAEDAAAGVQGRTADIFGETMRTEGPAKGKQAFGKMEGDVSPFIPSEEAQLKAGRTYDQRTVAERERAAQEQAVETQTPFELTRQRDLLADRVDDLETRIARAAAKGDVDTVTRLTAQRAQASAALEEAIKVAKAAGPVEVRPEDQFQRLNEEYNKRIKELQKAGDLGDFAKIEKVSGELRGLQEQLRSAKDVGPDLFAVEKASIEKEAVAKSKSEAETNAALAQGQQDLLAQIGKPETRVDARQRQVLDRYNDNVRQLEEAYAANADKRLVDQLVDKVQADAAERVAIIAKTSDTRTLAQEEAAQQRIARITRAIAEAEAKQDTGSVAGLRNQLAKAIVDTARPAVDSRRSRALEDQMAAAEQVRSAIEDLKSGRYLGEGAKDPSMAASLRSGLEKQANEAVGRYVEAAIRDVQALREQNGQKKMTVTEATRLAMDVRGHLEKAINNRNEAAFAIPKGDIAIDRTRKLGQAPQSKLQPTLVQRGAVSSIERQLAQIKKKYHKGEPFKIQRGEEILRQEFEPKKRKKGEEGTPYETPERKAERLEQAEAEAAAQKRMAQDVGNVDQLGLFTTKELEPIATVRATPENFQRLLNSDAVQKLRAKLDSLEKATPEATKDRTLKDKQQEAVGKLRANEVAAEKAEEIVTKLDQAIEKTNKQIDVLRKNMPFTKEDRTEIASLKKLLLEQIRRRRDAATKLEALENSQQRAVRLAQEIETEKGQLAPNKQRLAALRKKLDLAERQAKVEQLEPLKSFSEQLESQRRLVAELADADKLADNLKFNAQQLWSMPATARENLQRIYKEYEEITVTLEKNDKRRIELEKEIQIVMRQAEGNPFRAETIIRNVQDELAKIKEENAKLIKKQESYVNVGENAQVSIDKIRRETPQRVAEIDRYHTRAAELLESNIDTERAILKGMEKQYARMNAASPQARAFQKQMDAVRKQTAIAERQLAEFKNKQNKTTRDLEQSRAEFDKTAATFRQEIASTVYRTQDVKLLKQKENLRNELTKELYKRNPDQNRITSLERQIASLQTTREVLAKKQTSIEGPSIKIGDKEVATKIQLPPATTEVARREKLEEARLRAVEEAKEKIEARKESVETRKKQLEEDLAAERGQKTPDAKKVERYENELVSYEYADLLRRELADELAKEKPVKKYVTELKADIASLESSYARKDIAERLTQESRLAMELKDVQAQIAQANNVIRGLEQSARKATKPEIKKQFEKRLLAARKQLEKLDQDTKLSLLDKEAKLKEQLADVRLYGVNVEKALVALGDKPGREQKTIVKGPPLSAEQKAKIKEAKAARRQLNEDFEAYLESKKRDDFDYYEALSGVKYRAVKEAPTKVDPVAAKQVTDIIESNLPKDVRVKSVNTYSDLPEKVKESLARDGIDPQKIRGFITPEGELYVIRNNHESIKDLERTYVHEIVGHEGVDRIIGREGMEALADRVQNAGGAMALAKKLGIEAHVQGAIEDYALSIKRLTEDKAPKERMDKAMRDMEVQIVRELVAFTAEKRVDETFRQKAGRWLQEIVGAIRNWLRKRGFAELSKATTSDIYNLISQSQRNYNKGELGAMRDINGNITYRTQAVFNPSIDPAEAATVGKVISRNKADKDKIKGNVLGMSYMHRFVDRFAGLDYIARNMRDKLEGLQMMYYNRLYDQRNNMIAEIATHGSVGLEKNTDGTYQYKTRKGPSLKNVFESVSKAKSEFGNAQATLDYFGTYLAMERAASNKGGLKAGLEKLDLSGKISETEANAILKKGRGNTSFQEARKQYRAYNDGMIDLMVESGRLSKEQAAELKKGDYVPYYRDKGGIVMDTEHNIRVGDLKTQAYLKELMGGDSAIVNFETGALQNTYMLTDMAMSNIASKNTAYTLNKLGMAEIKPGSGPAKASIIRFYENGKEMHAEINTRGNYMELEARLDKMREAGKANTPEYKKLREKAEASRASEGAFGDIPAELIVKGMEGVASVMPAGVSMMRGPADLLRKAVTRNPAYALRVAFKDSISGWVTSGADIKPIVSTLGGIKKSLKGSDEIRALQQQGVIGGHVFAGTLSDMRTIAQQIAQGQSGWEKLWAKADRMAMMADEAQRVTLYNGFIKKGLSPMEASLATLESQNFTKHGYSPTIKALSTMIPFFNAQIQGLNAFGRAITGTSLFQDKLEVRKQMLKRGTMLAAATMGYSALMQNNEAYQNATDIDKLNHWFIPLPFMSEPLRVPIPFETGLVFKAIPEAIYNLMATDAKSKDVLPAVGRQVLNSVPGMSNLFLPQGVKPVVELATGTNLFTMQDIESVRQKAELPGYRAGTNTTEISKAIGKALNVSPVQLDHAVNAYTSSLGIALLSMFNPMLRDAEAPDAKASQMPILGGFFQPTDGAGLIDKAYKDMDELDKINRTFKRLEESNPDEAERFLDKYIDSLDRVSAAGKFKKDMGELNKEERLIRSDKEMTASQKRAELDEIKQLKIELSKEFMSISRE